MAAKAKISAPLVTDIEKTEWTASLKTLLALEDAFGEDRRWRGSDAHEFRETGDDTGFMMRRLGDPFDNEFRDLAQAWANKDYGAIMRDERGSHVSVAAEHPGDYEIIQHAEHVHHSTGVDKTGTKFIDNKAKVYASAIMQDYMWVKCTGQPMYAHVLWWTQDSPFGRHYERLLLPVKNVIVSLTVIHNPKFDGSAEYSANIFV